MISSLLPVFLIVGLFWLTLWNPLLLDCDETFNYLEPIYSLLFGPEKALQTWEWSPEYALRPYIYPLLYVFPASLALWLSRTLALIFPLKIVPSSLGILKAFLVAPAFISDWNLASSFSELVYDNDGKRAQKTFFMVLSGVSLAFAPGQWVAGTAVLPNSFSKMLMSMALTRWIRGRNYQALLLLAASTIIGWAYVPVLFYPIIVTSMKRQTFKNLVQRLLLSGVFSAVYILGPTILFDRIFYGRWTLSSLNTLLYNLASSSRPALYGVERWNWYIKNLCLNFNIILPLALLAWPVLILKTLKRPKGCFAESQEWRIISVFSFTIISGLVIFSLQPHKEERFLYPLYPLIVLLGVWVLMHHRKFLYPLSIVFAILSAARIAGLITYHRGTIDLFHQNHLREVLLTSRDPVVCLGESWFRFPSHFCLPLNTRVGFVERPGNQCLLPQYFTTNRASTIKGRFNSDNRPSPNQYVRNEECLI